MNVWLALLLTMLSWAATFHVGKHLLTTMPPAGTVIWRFAIAAAFLIPVVTLRERWDWQALRRNAVALLILGGIGISGFQLGMFYGLQSSSATNAALIMALGPALTALLVALIERRAVRALCWLGLALGLLGVLVVATGGSWSAMRSLSFARGDAWLAGGAFSWAVYSVILRRYVHGVSMLQLSATTILICGLVMALGTAIASPEQLRMPPAAAWAPLLFIGVVGSGLAYLWWNAAVMKIGAARAASFMNLVPVFTMAIGIVVGEALGVSQLVGAVLVIGGVLLAIRASPS